jgi:hypothetical protein
MEKAEKPKSESGTAMAAGVSKETAHEAKATAHGKRYGEALKRLVVEQIEGGKLRPRRHAYPLDKHLAVPLL